MYTPIYINESVHKPSMLYVFSAIELCINCLVASLTSAYPCGASTIIMTVIIYRFCCCYFESSVTSLMFWNDFIGFWYRNLFCILCTFMSKKLDYCIWFSIPPPYCFTLFDPEVAFIRFSYFLDSFKYMFSVIVIMKFNYNWSSIFRWCEWAYRLLYCQLLKLFVTLYFKIQRLHFPVAFHSLLSQWRFYACFFLSNLKFVPVGSLIDIQHGLCMTSLDRIPLIVSVITVSSLSSIPSFEYIFFISLISCDWESSFNTKVFKVCYMFKTRAKIE